MSKVSQPPSGVRVIGGALGGAAAGFLIAGPSGAVAGAIVGGAIGAISTDMNKVV